MVGMLSVAAINSLLIDLSRVAIASFCPASSNDTACIITKDKMSEAKLIVLAEQSS